MSDQKLNQQAVDELLKKTAFNFLQDYNTIWNTWTYEARERFLSHVKNGPDIDSLVRDDADLAYTTYKKVLPALTDHGHFKGDEGKLLLATRRDKIVFKVKMNANLIKDIREEVRSYDLHYSNIRTTACTFLLTAALGTFALVADGKATRESIRLFMFIPVIFVWTSFLLWAYFLKLTAACLKFQKLIEATCSATSSAVEVEFPSDFAESRRKVGAIYDTLKTFSWKYWDPPQKMLLFVAVAVTIVSIWLVIFPETVKSKAMDAMPLSPWVGKEIIR